MKHFLLFALLIGLVPPACTVNPFIRSGETVVSLGGSIFTKTAGESGYYEGPLGKLGYANATKDETVVPGKLINYYGIKAAVTGATEALRTTESTKRILSGHEVQKTGIQSTERIELKKLEIPVEEALPGATPVVTAP